MLDLTAIAVAGLLAVAAAIAGAVLLAIIPDPGPDDAETFDHW